MSPDIAFYERIRSDAGLLLVLGAYADGFARAQGGWPEDFKDAATFPLVTYITVAGRSVRPNLREFRVQADVWVWPAPGDGAARVHAIDEALLTLFDEKQWWGSGFVRWNSVALGYSDPPAGPGYPLRRRRDFDLTGTVDA